MVPAVQQEMVYQIPQLDKAGVAKTNANYDDPHHGVSLVCYLHQHPTLAEAAQKVQFAVQGILNEYDLVDCLKTYQEDQLHCTVIQLVDENNLPDRLNQTAQIIENIQPFSLIFGSGAKLPEEGRDQTLRLTDEGQIVMKGVAVEPNYVSTIRTTFDEEAGITHIYGNDDDQVYAVLGYFLNTKVNDSPECLSKIHAILRETGKAWNLRVKVEKLAIASFQERTLFSKFTKQIHVNVDKQNPHIENLAKVLKEQAN